MLAPVIMVLPGTQDTGYSRRARGCPVQYKGCVHLSSLFIDLPHPTSSIIYTTATPSKHTIAAGMEVCILFIHGSIHACRSPPICEAFPSLLGTHQQSNTHTPACMEWQASVQWVLQCPCVLQLFTARRETEGWARRSPLPSKIDEEQHGALLYPAAPTTPYTLHTHRWPRRCAPWLRVNRSSSLCNFRVTCYKCGSPQTCAAYTFPLTQLGHHWRLVWRAVDMPSMFAAEVPATPFPCSVFSQYTACTL